MAVPRRTLALLRKLAKHNGAIIDVTVRDITTGWLSAWDDLGPSWQAAVSAILAQYAATGQWPAPWQVARIEAIARATEKTEQALTGLLADAATTTSEAAGRISSATLDAEPLLIASQTSKVSAADLTVPKVRADSALDARRTRINSLLRPIGASALNAITWEFTHPPTPDTGRRPLAGMSARVKSGFDAGLTRVLTIARTEPVEAYRTASALVHAANPSVVTEWAWLSQLDLRACVSCWAMHGSRHPIEESGPESHPSCRCMRLPLAGSSSLPSAEARFRRLTRRQQIAILGPTRHDLWRSGAVPWSALAARRSNKGWRDAVVPTPVADLQRMANLRDLLAEHMGA